MCIQNIEIYKAYRSLIIEHDCDDKSKLLKENNFELRKSELEMY